MFLSFFWWFLLHLGFCCQFNEFIKFLCLLSFRNFIFILFYFCVFVIFFFYYYFFYIFVYFWNFIFILMVFFCFCFQIPSLLLCYCFFVFFPKFLCLLSFFDDCIKFLFFQNSILKDDANRMKWAFCSFLQRTKNAISNLEKNYFFLKHQNETC